MAVPVSVVIPVHNRAGLIERAVRSALAQTLTPAEVIVVDDGSTDDTAAVVKEIGHPAVALIQHETRQGASAARNTGIEWATGDVLAFLDSDDGWVPHRLQRQVTDTPTAGLLLSAFVVHAGPKRRPATPGCFRGDAHRRLLRLRGGPLTASAMLLDRRAGADDLRFDTDLVALEDLDLAIRASATLELGHVDEPLVVKHSAQPDRLYTPQAEYAARFVLIRKHRSELSRDRVAMAAHLVAIARAAAALGYDDITADHLRHAVWIWPAAPTCAARAGWRLRGPAGLQRVCQAWSFAAENPRARLRLVLS